MNYKQRVQELEQYVPALTGQPNLENFWEQTLSEARSHPLAPTMAQREYPLEGVRVFKISYHGFDSTPVYGWFLLPASVGPLGRMPCVIHYHGFGGSKGLPYQFLPWMMLGAAVLSVDCREQGGETGNQVPASGGLCGNVTTKGILDEHLYYYRAVYTDCVRAIDYACSLPQVDPSRVIVRGSSQGGGLAIAAAALDGRPYAAFAHVPSGSNLESRVEQGAGAFAAVGEYLKKYPEHVDRAFQTLSYFDTMNLAHRISCPVYASVALRDTVCPPECFYATYNRIQNEKSIRIYPYNNHHDGEALQVEDELNRLGFLLRA